MKKKIFAIFLFLLGIAGSMRAQDFEPGEQAKGYTDTENTSVNLSTGLFHYKVPLFTLSDGNFVLPISLNYVGRGVTTDQAPGQIWFNWSLQAGGVVTRTVRGGIADEASNGAMHNKASNIQQASSRELDGESDIFTVNFNNRTLNFLLTPGYRTVQLEQSDVEISCLHDLDGITGWKVLDENGIQYFYRETEEMENRSHESSVSNNNVANKNYISSWFITSIVVPNADTIKFEYGVRELDPPYDIQPNMEDRVKTDVFNQLYMYGRPINEYMFNDTYMSQYKEAINSALFHMRQENVVMQNQLNQENSRYIDNYSTWNNNIASIIRGELLYQQRVMGLLTGITDLSGVTVGLANFLDQTIDYCNSVGGTMSAYELKRAKSLLKLMCTRAKTITEKLVEMATSYHIRTPLLKRIVTRDKNVELEYLSELSEIESRHVLRELTLLDASNKVIQRVSLTRSLEGCLKEIKTELTGGGEHVLSFSYYLENTTPKGVDLWGQWINFSRKSLKDMTRSDVDPEYAQRYSLSDIRLSTGINIHIDYELNIEQVTPMQRYPSGGIRVKNISINKGSGSIESVLYEYPNFAKRVFENISNRDTVNYRGGIASPFRDIIIKDRITPTGTAHVQTGNNGVYYDRVIVTRSGKGREVYSFYVPSPAYDRSRLAFPHGLCGLLLGKASYDKENKLVELVKNKYESGYASQCVDPEFSSWFIPNNTSGIYEKSVQIKPYDYCLDQTKLENEFHQQPPVTTYSDRDGPWVLVPYDNIYLENIEPRVDVIIPEDYYYFLLHEGKTVLSEQVVYCFPDGSNIPFSINQVQENPPSLGYVAKHVKFKYNNTRCGTPIQTIEYLSSGDTLVTVACTPRDIAARAEPILGRMCEHHIIAPIVKKQQFLKPKGSSKYFLLAEEITRFKDTITPTGKTVFLPDRIYRHLRQECDSLVPVSSGIDQVFFSHPTSNYRQEQAFRYKYSGGHFLAAEMASPAKTTVTCHDQGRGNVIMKAENTRRSLVDAIDALRVPDSPNTTVSSKDGCLGKNLPTSLIVYPIQETRQFKVYILVKSKQSSLKLDYSITRGSIITNESTDLKPVAAGEWTLVAFDIDLPSGVNILEVHLPSGTVALATLTPAGTIFEAKSLDLEGKLFCKLNQNGQLERYEYGPFKKVKRIWDEKGNIIKDSYYNF